MFSEIFCKKIGFSTLYTKCKHNGVADDTTTYIYSKMASRVFNAAEVLELHVVCEDDSDNKVDIHYPVEDSNEEDHEESPDNQNNDDDDQGLIFGDLECDESLPACLCRSFRH